MRRHTAPLGEGGIFNFIDVVFESWFIRAVGFIVLITGLAPDGTNPFLLLQLGLIPHGNVLDIDAFFVIMMRRLPSCTF